MAMTARRAALLAALLCLCSCGQAPPSPPPPDLGFDGRPVALTATEMALLGRLLARPDHVTSRAQLFEAVYGGNAEASDRTVDSHLRNLRRKLAEAGCAEALETVHGIGVRMGPCRVA